MLNADNVTCQRAIIIAEIDAGGLGLGATWQKLASMQRQARAPQDAKEDAGEDVAYTVEIIVFDYDIKLVCRLEEFELFMAGV